MPIPLIAAALIAVGSVSGGSGIALGGKGAYDIKRARDRLAEAERRYQRKRKQTDDVVVETNERLANLGTQQQDALERVVLRMGEFLRRHEKQVRDSERLLIDGIDVTVGRVSGDASLDSDAVAWVRGVLRAAVAGGGVSSGVTAAVGSYGVASTEAAV